MEKYKLIVTRKIDDREFKKVELITNNHQNAIRQKESTIKNPDVVDCEIVVF